MWVNDAALFFQTAIAMGTPLLFATLGEILTERAGHLNLGVEGMMLMGASFGFFVGYNTGNPLLAVLVAGLAGALGALIFAVLTVTFRTNQMVTGFTLTIFLTGVANFLGNSLGNLTLSPEFIAAVGPVSIPGLSEIPFLGVMLFQQNAYIYFGLIMAVAVWVYVYKTRFGLALRMVGENPSAAETAGIRVTRCKYAHILAGGFLCGLGGACLTLVIVPRWQESVTAGMGWIAIALVIFATWNPLKAILGAYLFGALRCLTYKLQNVPINIGGLSISIPSQILDLLPYLMTIVVLVLTTMGRRRENSAPGWLGKAYFREDR
jgi:simple sugar transport system permease protein